MHIDKEGFTKKIPFLRILLGFLAGVLAAEYYYSKVQTILFILVCFGGFIVLFHLFPAYIKWRFKLLSGCFIIALLVLLGMVCRSSHPFKLDQNLAISEGCFILRIEQINSSKQNTFKTECSVFVKNHSTWTYKNKCIVYIRNRDDLAGEGLILLTFINPIYIKPMHNPGGYNYAFQQHIKGIFYQATLDEKTSVEVIGKQDRKFSRWIHSTRDSILQILKKSLNDKKIVGLAEAMMIGYRGDLDETILNSYINTGVVHVIAISGMHLSLIFLLIDLFVGFVFKKKRKDMIGLFITIPLLWLFAILTGSSASVVRSAVMLTFILISKTIGKRSSGMNALLGSAFMLIAWSPWIIYDLGFQLSYLAVASMMLFEKPIRLILYTQNLFITKGWQMISVTIAAQILTAPVSIFNFHQFPTLFLFTNLIAIPLSSIILIAEIALCISDVLHIPHVWIDISIHQLIAWLNGYIANMENVALGMMRHIHIGLYSMLWAYVLIFSFRFFTNKQTVVSIQILLIFFEINSIIYQIEKSVKLNQHTIIIPRLKSGIAVFYKRNDIMWCICSKQMGKNNAQINSLTEQFSDYYWVKNIKIVSVSSNPIILKINLQKPNKEVFYIISGNPPGIAFLSKLNIPPNNRVIADATNKLWKIRIWETEAEKLLLRFHSVSESGPFVLDLPKLTQ